MAAETELLSLETFGINHGLPWPVKELLCFCCDPYIVKW